MTSVTFTFTELSIHVIIPYDLCTIFKNGYPIWSGSREQLTNLLESI